MNAVVSDAFVDMGGLRFRRANHMQVVRAEAALPRAQTVWLEDSIHDVPLQRPSFVAEVIAGFLKELVE